MSRGPDPLTKKTIPQLAALLRVWRFRGRRRRLHLARLRKAGAPNQQRIAAQESWNQAMRSAGRIEAAIAWKRKPMRIRALEIARGELGVRESGGNNRGPRVSEYIRENGGTGPEAWCGDFAAFCYRGAGSRAVQRLWAAVRFIGRLAGMRILKSVRSGMMGDLVCFRFAGGGDHVGILEGYCDADGNVMRPATATHVQTIDGNTSGDDVSDSASGGDGVGRQIRPIGLVERVVRVTR